MKDFEIDPRQIKLRIRVTNQWTVGTPFTGLVFDGLEIRNFALPVKDTRWRETPVPIKVVLIFDDPVLSEQAALLQMDAVTGVEQ